MGQTKTKVRLIEGPGESLAVEGVLFLDNDRSPMIAEFTYTRSYVSETGSLRKEDGKARFWAKYLDGQRGQIGLLDDEGGIWKFAILPEPGE